MAKFTIATPGGYEVEVVADTEEAALEQTRANWRTMPRIILKEGNTRVFQRPNGDRYLVSEGYSTTDAAVIDKVISGTNAARASRSVSNERLLAQFPWASKANEFLRGVPFVGSYTDEALGAAFGPQAAQASRAVSSAMQEERPGQTLALNVAGGLTGAAGAAALAPLKVAGAVSGALGQGSRAAQIARGLATGATAGGVEGAIYGFGEGVGAQERLTEAGRGAKIGATAGGVFGASAPIVSEVAGNVMGLLRRSDISQIARELNISRDAARVIKNTFDQGGDIQEAMKNLAKAGNEAMIADAGPAAQALLDATAVSGGRAGRIATGAIRDRMSRTSNAVERALDASLGTPPFGPQTAVREIAERTAPQRNAAYNLAYESAIDYSGAAGRAIEDVLSRVNPSVMQRAISEANEEMLANNIVNQQIMAVISDNGSVSFVEMPNVQQLDELKKALQSIAYDNVDEFNRLTTRGRRYAKLAAELRDAISSAVEPYGAAVALGGDKLAEERAFSIGYDLLRPKTRLEDVVFELGNNPSQAQIEASKRGLRAYIDETLGNVRAIASDPSAEAVEARQVVKAVLDMSSDNARDKIKRVLGAEADALLSQIDEAAQSAAVNAAMAVNSKTAPRLATQETIKQLTEPGIVGQALSGEAVNTSKALIRAVTGMTSEYSERRRQAIYEDIARALTEKGGNDARAAIQMLDAAIQGQSLSDAETDFLSKVIASVIFVGATTGTTASAGAERRQSQPLRIDIENPGLLSQH